ncbi:MAG: PFL family protein, partial [Candidatus Riflebacteria bacterium]|nr:PFL family protein [Candidatus Riflebacteria bacterium]
MYFSIDEVIDTIRAVGVETFDIRTITCGINLMSCADSDVNKCAEKVYEKVVTIAKDLVPTARKLEKSYGIPIVNKRVSVSPVSFLASAFTKPTAVPIAKALDRAAKELGIDFIAGFSSLIHKGINKGDQILLDSISEALCTTERVCSSVNVGSSKAGINMDGVLRMAQIVKEVSEKTADKNGLGCAKLVVFCNAVEDNPFVAGSFLGPGEPEAVLNVGISGPGVVRAALASSEDLDMGELADLIKKISFKITRTGDLIGREASKMMGIPFGIIDLSLAPTPAEGDSISDILELMGLESTGCHGTTAALAMLNDAVKKGGMMATTYAGGLSGAFIPLTEDSGMVKAVENNSLCIQKLEAMTCVCSVGLDMIAIPGDTSVDIIAGIIADEAAIGMINNKTTAARLIPVPGKKAGEYVDFGGLLGKGPIIDVERHSPSVFVHRGGRIPAPVHSMK